MAGVCRLSGDYLMFDVTAVDNLFIEEYMLRAPGDYVKVYLYGLRLSYATAQEMTMARMAQVLGMDEELIAEAFLYWERQGLVHRLSDQPPAYEYINLRQAVLQGMTHRFDEALYPTGDFGHAFRRAMEGQLLHAEDFAKVYGWMDTYGFDEQAVLLITNYFVGEQKRKGRKTPSMAFLDKQIRQLGKAGIITPEAVSEHLHALTDDYQNTRALLRHMGVRKEAPSQDEVRLYQKWSAWGYQLETLKHLCAEMTRIQKPNMAYLDKIVENYHDMGMTEWDEVSRYQVQLIEPLRNVLAALGSPGQLNRPLMEKYTSWLAAGFSQEVLEELARHCRARNGASLSYYEKVLSRMQQQGILTLEALAAYRAHLKELEELAAQVLALSGEPRQPTQAERAQVEGWLMAGSPQELLPLAAAQAKTAKSKLSYISRLLDTWRVQGITTAAQAQSALRSGKAGADAAARATGRVGKEVAEQRYTQRTYEDKDLEELFLPEE